MKKIILKEKRKDQGIALVLAILISGIIFLVALGITGVSVKEIQFSISNKDANEAFFAADTGAECALYNDGPTKEIFYIDSETTSLDCLKDKNIEFVYAPNPWVFVTTGLGNSEEACAIVTVSKTFDDDGNTLTTQIVSKGYNLGNEDCSLPENRVERVLELNY